MLYTFLESVIPETIPPDATSKSIFIIIIIVIFYLNFRLIVVLGTDYKTRKEFIEDVGKGMKVAPMSVR